MLQIEPGSLAMREPVSQLSVGRLELLHGILLVCVSEPQTVCASFLVSGIIWIVRMMSPLEKQNIKIVQSQRSERQTYDHSGADIAPVNGLLLHVSSPMG